MSPRNAADTISRLAHRASGWLRAVHAPAYLASKRANLQRFSVLATLVTATFVACTWSWDYAIDPHNVGETFWLRAAESAAVFLLAAVIHRDPSGWATRFGLFLVPAFVMVTFVEVLARLDGGATYGIGGFLYFFIFVPFISQTQSLRFNTLLLASLALLPNLLWAMGPGSHLNLPVYNAYVWQAFAPVVLILALVEHLIHRIHTQHDHLQTAANTDRLTTLPNRHFLFDNGSTLMQQTLASGRPVSLLIMDIDHFKGFNDHHGHACGDDVLRQVAERLQQCGRDTDLLARIGGEEFVAVLPGTDAADARAIGERMCRVIAERDFEARGVRAGPLQVTISAGCASAEAGCTGTTLAALMAEADEALYRAKRLGRNRVEAAGQQG